MFRSEALVLINRLNMSSSSAPISSTTISTSSSLFIIVRISDTSHFSQKLKLSTRVSLIRNIGSLRPDSVLLPGCGIAISDSSDRTIDTVVALTSFNSFTTSTRLCSSSAGAGAEKVFFIPFSESNLFMIAFFSCFRGRRWGAMLLAEWSAAPAMRRNADWRLWRWSLARRRRSLAAAHESAIFSDASETSCASFSCPRSVMSSFMPGEPSNSFTESWNSFRESKSNFAWDIFCFSIESNDFCSWRRIILIGVRKWEIIIKSLNRRSYSWLGKIKEFWSVT